MQTHRVFTSGILCNYSNNPAIIEPEGGRGGAIFRDVTRCDILASIGLFDRAYHLLSRGIEPKRERLEVLTNNQQLRVLSLEIYG